MNKVLITGSSGFVGKNLLSYFENLNYKTFGASLKVAPQPDLTYIDSIVHLAGKAHDLRNVAVSDEYYLINFDLTKEIYDSYLKSKACKFIFISSVKASADCVEGALGESDVPDPQTHYGKSKRMAEEFIIGQALPEGKSYFILRPCIIHGPGNKGNLNLLYKLISKGIPYPLASFENKRSFLSIENLCFVIRELLERDDIPSGVYNVADDEPLSTNELMGLIAQSQNRNPKLWNISKKFIEGIASIGDKLHLPLNTERLQKLTSSYVVSNAKIKAAIDKPLPVSSREGLLKTFKSFNS